MMIIICLSSECMQSTCSVKGVFTPAWLASVVYPDLLGSYTAHPMYKSIILNMKSCMNSDIHTLPGWFQCCLQLAV